MTKMTQEEDTSNTAPVTFKTTILQTGKNTAGILVPEAVIARLRAGKQPLVVVTIKKHTYRSAIATMGGKSMISLSAKNRESAGVRGGEEADVTIRLDTKPRTVELPTDLRAALAQADALEAFEKTAPSMKKEFVRQVEEAKAVETRLRRITKIVEKLSSK